MNIKRPMTLVAGILGTVAQGIVSILMAIGLVTILDFAGGADGTATLLFVGILELAVFVVGLVMSIISITAWAKNPEGFKKKKGIMITAIVFDFIGAIIGFIVGSLFYILFALVLIAAAVLHIVDISIENSRVKKATPVEENN